MREKKKSDFITEMESMLSPELVSQAREEAKQEIFQIRLSQLRKEMGIKQEDLSDFSQSSISKIEKRKDMKISTLVNYLKSLGMDIEIRAYSKKNKKNKKFVLLKT